MTRDRPPAVTGATWLSMAVVAMTGLTALLTLVLKDELVDAWASSRSESSAVEPPAFVPVAITMFVVVALLAAVLISMMREGHEWARILMSGIVVLVGVATLAIVRTDPPPVFLVVAAVSLVVDVAAVVVLWHRDTRAYCRHPRSSTPTR